MAYRMGGRSAAFRRLVIRRSTSRRRPELGLSSVKTGGAVQKINIKDCSMLPLDKEMELIDLDWADGYGMKVAERKSLTLAI